MFLFALVCGARATTTADLVGRWFDEQEYQWSVMRTHCNHVAVLFSDATWMDLTLELVRELVAPPMTDVTCVALWFWASPNHTLPGWCDVMPCFVDTRASAPASWGAPVYFNKIAHRMPVMHAIIDRLPLNARRGLALIDSDVFLHRRSFLPRLAREHANATLVAQQEWPCATAPAQLCANGGVWWVRRTELGRELVARAARLMHTLACPDQDALDVVLAGRHDVGYLDRLRYANGRVARYDRTWTLHGAHLVHANWLPNIDAKRRWLSALRARARRGSIY